MKSLNTKLPTSFEIVLMGELMVNLPVLGIFLITALLCTLIGVVWNLSLLIGVFVGWFCWGKLINVWKMWALKRNIDREKLFRLGKIGFINFFRYKIFESEIK
ncbi:MAG: hypothetical protein WCH34_15230 [Bacteroidota bacterium]